MSTVKVAYCGLKPQETDCVAGTGLTWVGVGDVHEVPLKAWDVMAKHPDVWELVIEPVIEDAADAPLGLADVTPKTIKRMRAPKE